MPNEKRQRQKAGRQERQEQIRAAQRRRRQRNQAILLGLIVVVAVAAAWIAVQSGGSKNAATTATTASTARPVTGTTPCPAADGSSPRTLKFAQAPPLCIDPAKTYTAHVSTSDGNFDVALDTKKTPNTTNNWVVLSRYHYYDNTTITRIDNSIEILQTGSPNTETISDPGPGYTIKDEGSGFQYTPGDVVMARSQGADSASAQYFLVYGAKAAALNSQGNYVTFGHVSGAGLDVLKQIGALYQACPANDQTCLGGRPSHKVTIKTITITEA